MGGDLVAQLGQRVQPLQHVSDTAVEPGAMPPIGIGGRVHACEQASHFTQELVALGNLRFALSNPPGAPRAKVKIRPPPLPLKTVHESAQSVDQLTGARELLEFGDFAALGGDEETEA